MSNVELKPARVFKQFEKINKFPALQSARSA